MALEMKKVLDQMINTRTIQIALPVTKSNKQKSIIVAILIIDKYLAKELEHLIGKLVHLSVIVLGASSFIKPLQSTLYSAKASIAKLDLAYREDLNLQLQLIDQEISDTLIKKLIQHIPISIYFTNTLGFSLGSYNLHNS